MSDLPLTPFGLLSEEDQQRVRDAGPEGREWYSNQGWRNNSIDQTTNSATYRLKAETISETETVDHRAEFLECAKPLSRIRLKSWPDGEWGCVVDIGGVWHILTGEDGEAVSWNMVGKDWRKNWKEYRDPDAPITEARVREIIAEYGVGYETKSWAFAKPEGGVVALKLLIDESGN